MHADGKTHTQMPMTKEVPLARLARARPDELIDELLCLQHLMRCKKMAHSEHKWRNSIELSESQRSTTVAHAKYSNFAALGCC
eukprot:3211347-Amphidinium_carterae.1